MCCSGERSRTPNSFGILACGCSRGFVPGFVPLSPPADCCQSATNTSAEPMVDASSMTTQKSRIEPRIARDLDTGWAGSVSCSWRLSPTRRLARFCHGSSPNRDGARSEHGYRFRGRATLEGLIGGVVNVVTVYLTQYAYTCRRHRDSGYGRVPSAREDGWGRKTTERSEGGFVPTATEPQFGSWRGDAAGGVKGFVPTGTGRFYTVRGVTRTA